jgi:hypothetical protein
MGNPYRTAIRPRLGSHVRNGMANNLVADYYPASSSPLTSQGSVSPMNLALAGSATYGGVSGSTAGIEGTGLICTNNDSGGSILAPPAIQLQTGSLCIRVQHLGNTGAYAPLGGVSYTNSNTSPYSAYQIGADVTGTTILGSSNITSAQLRTSATAIVTGAISTYVLTFQGKGNLSFYRNGVLISTNSYSGTSILYGTPYLAMGFAGFNLTVSANMIFYGGRIYSRPLTLNETAIQHSNWYDLYPVTNYSFPFGYLASTFKPAWAYRSNVAFSGAN